MLLIALYKCKNIVTRFLLILVSIAVIGTAIYTGLVGSALMGLEESN